VNPDPATKRPTASRPFLWSQAPFLALLAVALPAMLWFAWHRGLATTGDDSVSYLVQARVFAGNAGPAVERWADTAARFPPLFPLLLAATGGSADMLRAHALVATCGALALVMVARFVAGITGDRRLGIGAAILFAATTSAWISLLGILSEPLYLLLSLAALEVHRVRAGRPGAAASWQLALGVLLAAAILTRAVGVTLLAACILHAAIAWRRDGAELRRRALALVPVVVLVGWWLALRSHPPGDNYARVAGTALSMLTAAPLEFVAVSAQHLAGAWVATFTAESGVMSTVAGFFVALGVAAVAGSVRAALLNRVDGWYVLAYLAVLFIWIFPEENTRRLLYPVAPLLLLHAYEFAAAVLRRATQAPQGRGLAILACAQVLLAAPALVVMASKATDRAPPFPGYPQDLAGMTSYYTTIALKPARETAGRDLAVLAGLAAIARDTPGDARVAWVRPDYVALLGEREAVPWYYAEGMEGLVRRLRESGAGYLVVSNVLKADTHGQQGEPVVTLASVAPFARVAYTVRNPAAASDEFALMRVDRAALDAYAATLAAAPRR
jgi:hypothetical protein